MNPKREKERERGGRAAIGSLPQVNGEGSRTPRQAQLAHIAVSQLGHKKKGSELSRGDAVMTS